MNVRRYIVFVILLGAALVGIGVGVGSSGLPFNVIGGVLVGHGIVLATMERHG